MKPSTLWICFLVTLTPGALRSQDVRVRVYTNRPLTELLAQAKKGQLHWRTCSTCAEQSGERLAIGGNLQEPSAILTLSGDYELRPPHGPAFSASYPLKIAKQNGQLQVTATIPLEDYVAAVLVAESGDFKNDESMKAMAVAARTYALRFRGQHEKDGFDFCDTTHCQVVGWKGGNARIRSAVAATAGETLQFAGNTAETYYHANCGGKTAAAKEVWPAVNARYLQSHADSYCTTSGGLLWESILSITDIARVLHEAGLTLPAGWTTIEIAARSESGRVQRLRVSGGNGADGVISASTFRFAIDRALGWNKIRSDLYDLRNHGTEIVFSGRGSGHGVGLCQAGAEEMAREGQNYHAILAFYYPGTQLAQTLNNSAKTIQWQKRSSERFDLLSANPESDSSLLSIADKILHEEETTIGWTLDFRPRLQVFSTLDEYRNTTGQPGWVAASTRGQTVRLQPLKELQRRSVLESTLRHELLHLLVEAHARAGTPLWFREGLVLYLSSPNKTESATPPMSDARMEIVLRQSHQREEVELAYRSAHSRVASAIQQYGQDAVLGWLRGGIPDSALRLNGTGSSGNH